MHARLPCLAVVLLVMCLPACDTDLSPLRDAFLHPAPPEPPTCDEVDRFVWLIRGFDFDDLPSPIDCTECVATLRVGDTRDLAIESANTFNVDCRGEIATVDWGSTTAGVVGLEPTGSSHALLTATKAGETSVFADLRFKTGQHKRSDPYVSAIHVATVRVLPR
jgi:hypothetical protein